MSTLFRRSSIITAALFILLGVTLSISHFHEDSPSSAEQHSDCSVCLLQGTLKSFTKPTQVVFKVALVVVNHNPIPIVSFLPLGVTPYLPYLSRAPPALR